jgi:tRNA uridine 5-carboxymethylaminomethyl modification enzyme
MFTSRAEYRLSLREDNADMRLTEAGRRLGLVGEARWAAFCEKREAIARERERLKSTWVRPGGVDRAALTAALGKPIEREYTLFDLLRRPEVSHAGLAALCPDGDAGGGPVPRPDSSVAEQIEIEAKYQGYIERQAEEVARNRANEETSLPEDLDYARLGGLSSEIRQKLAKHRPRTVGQASRIQGVTPAAISILLVHLKRAALAAARGRA